MTKWAKVKSFVVTFMVVAMMLTGSAFAARETIYIPKNEGWSSSCADSRSMDYKDVLARCYAVYPTNGGNDSLKKICVKVTNADGTIISESGSYTLKESAKKSKSIPIKNGYLRTGKVIFKFRGCTTSAAKADVYYNAR